MTTATRPVQTAGPSIGSRLGHLLRRRETSILAATVAMIVVTTMVRPTFVFSGVCCSTRRGARERSPSSWDGP